MDAVYRDEGWLREKYHGEGMGVRTVASEVGVSPNTVKKWMDRHDIERRPGPSKSGPHRDEDWLREKYHGEMMSISEMADEADISRTQIHSWMERHGIERRSAGESVNERGTMDGENNPAWKGGYSSDKGWRLGHEWISTRREVMRRDDRECQRCGDSGKVVHHITPVSEGGPKFELDNLTTLCRACHQKVH